MNTDAIPFPSADSEQLASAVGQFERFVKREISPIVSEYRGTVFPKKAFGELLRKLVPYGIGVGTVASSREAPDLSFVASGLLYEALARSSPDLAMACFPHESATIKISRASTPSVRERLLPQMLSGDLIGCSGITEPGAGSNVRQIETRAVRRGDRLVLNGEKIWISNVTVADLILVLAKTAENELTIVCVETNQPGVQVSEIDMLGLDSSPFGQVSLSDVEVPLENVVGGFGGGLRETMKGFERARTFAGVIALGIAATVLDRTIEFAKTREQFGQPIGVFQLIQQSIAQMATDFEASRLLVYRTLMMMDQGTRCETEAAMAKSFTTEAAFRIASSAIQVHGAMGLSRELGIESLFRSARMLMIPDGTTHINQLIIARKLLGLNAFPPPEAPVMRKAS